MKNKKFFEKIARDWDAEHSTPEETERTRQFALEHFQLKEGETVLDIGCGTSRLVPHLQKKIGAVGRLVEMDFSMEMLRIGFKKYHHTFSNLLFTQGDGHAPPFRDGCFDTVVCMAFFPHLSDKAKAMKALARLLKPGGTLYIAHQMNREELNKLHADVDGPVKTDRLPGKPRMRELLAGAGFKNVSIREEPGLYLATATV